MPRIPVTVDPELEPIMARYLNLRRKELIRLEAALEKGNFATVTEFGHILKGNGTSYGLPRLSELGEAVEAAGSAGDRDEALRLAREIRDYIENVDITFGQRHK